MNGFYQDIITQKSWDLLLKLKEEVDFVLIGGWAVYLWAETLKSKDIDIVIDYQVLETLKKKYNVVKNVRLRKYEIKREGIDIDIYLPYFSGLGLPVEELFSYVIQKEKFKILKKEVLLVLKQKAYSERKMVVKGQKDKIDIISLVLLPDFDFNFYKRILEKHKLKSYLKMLREIFEETREVKELNLNRHQFAKIKKQILELIQT